MQNIEKRIATLEDAGRQDAHMSVADVEARIDEILVGIGTSLDEQLAQYGSKMAFVAALSSLVSNPMGRPARAEQGRPLQQQEVCRDRNR